MAPVGRPPDYRPGFAETAKALCENGATDWDLAQYFEVARSTIYLWKIRHPEFSAALKCGKASADEQIERSLFERARGYSHEVVKIHIGRDGAETVTPYVEHYPPDTTAAIFWLKNRRPDRWRERREPEAAPAQDMTEEEVDARIRELLDKAKIGR